jgi:hypothetical protein
MDGMIMKANVLVLTTIVALSLLAGPAANAVNKQGVIGMPAPKDAPYQVRVDGKLMTLDGQFWSEEGGLGGGQHVHFDAKITNKSSANAFYSVYVALMDKKWKLIAADGFTQVFAQAPGKTDHHGADMYLPQNELGNIGIYQVTLYDDTVNVGKQ